MKSEKFVDLKLFIFIAISLLFLSANSIIARMALITQNIDAFSFTFLRIFSGTILLLIIYFLKNKKLDLNMKKMISIMMKKVLDLQNHIFSKFHLLIKESLVFLQKKDGIPF